ncbi:MAG TPA: hypothetical protein VND99_06280 [Candidatus Acidoferrales bacterium]|nr:hypothetical protein [Candidatus Acidoferrales bacterium]
MNNRVIIALFILFLLIVFLSSLQTASKSHKATAVTTSANSVIQRVTPPPSPIPTAMPTPTLIPPPTLMPVQLPQYRINGGFGGDD